MYCEVMTKFHRSKFKKKEQKKRWYRVLMSPFFLSVLAIGVMVLAGATYLVETNTIAIQGYEIKELESTLMTLKEEKQMLEIQVSQLESLQNIEQQVNELGMLTNDHVEYIVDQSGDLAVR